MAQAASEETLGVEVILVTGALGSVGRALTARLLELGHDVTGTDIETMNVTDARQVRHFLRRKRPDVILHLAGAKHAPQGEDDPFHVLNVNAVGTRNVLEAAGGAKMILASTCKACDPETAYGASKLVAERMVLNAGGVVVRYYNIPESSGNVFRYWESLPLSAPIPWTDCWRYFVSMEDALAVTLDALTLPSGRYAPRPGHPRHMHDVALGLYPGRSLVQVPLRRGDRSREPLHASCESAREVNGYFKITSPHDPQTVSTAAVAA